MAGSALVTGGQAGHEMAGLSLGRTLTTGLITERMLGGEEEEEEGEAMARLFCPELWLAVSPLPPSCPAQTDSPVRAWPAGGRSLSLTTCNTDWTVASAGEGGRGGGSCRNKLENINTTSSHVVSQ